MRVLNLIPVTGLYAICQLKPNDSSPDWLAKEAIHAFIKDGHETTIIARQEALPQVVKADRDWLMFRVTQSFGFNEAGVVLSLIKPLSENGIGIFILSTFSSDLLMIKSDDLVKATDFLTKAGHTVSIV